MGEEDALQSQWNFDAAEMYAIFEIKKQFIYSMDKWNLEQAYWSVRTLRRELDAKLQRAYKKSEEEQAESKNKPLGKTEKAIVDQLLLELEENRKIFNESEKSEDDKGNYYLELENFYMHLCFLMKKHGLYFREGEDMTRAITRR